MFSYHGQKLIIFCTSGTSGYLPSRPPPRPLQQRRSRRSVRPREPCAAVAFRRFVRLNVSSTPAG
eukprot:3733540-Pleurochrysis_carterae.AAC.1